MTDNPNQTTTSADTLFASVTGMAAPLAGDECMFLAGQEGKAHPMTIDVLQAMDQCRNFRTRAAHVDAIVHRLPALEEHRDAIGKVLQFLINRHLMVSSDSMLEKISEQADEVNLPPLTTAFIFTDSRPAALTRLAQSIVEHGENHASRMRYVVIDQSRSREMVASNAEALAVLHDAGISVEHLDREWCRRLIDHLSQKTGHDAAWLEAALLGSGGNGDSLNLALLLGAGERILLIEDQFSLQAMRRGASGTGLDLTQRVGERSNFETT
jgi:hypothetical protein